MIWFILFGAYLGFSWGFAIGAAAARGLEDARWVSILFAPVVLPCSIVIELFR